MNSITQSAVSQQLRTMERHFKVLIIDRSQKKFRLTREGQKLYDCAKEILHRYEKLNCELQEMRKVISGNIHIATIYSIGLHELPPYIKRFLKKYPSVNVRVEYRRSNLVYDDILHNAVDLGLVAFPNRKRQVEVIPFCEDDLVLICHPKHRLAQYARVSVSELKDDKLIGFESDIPTRRATDQILRDQNLNPEPIMEFDNIETVKRAVEINAGIAIVPQATVQQEKRQGTIAQVGLNGGAYTRPLAIIHRKGRALTPAMKKFIETLTSMTGREGKD